MTFQLLGLSAMAIENTVRPYIEDVQGKTRGLDDGLIQRNRHYFYANDTLDDMLECVLTVGLSATNRYDAVFGEGKENILGLNTSYSTALGRLEVPVVEPLYSRKLSTTLKDRGLAQWDTGDVADAATVMKSVIENESQHENVEHELINALCFKYSGTTLDSVMRAAESRRSEVSV